MAAGRRRRRLLALLLAGAHAASREKCDPTSPGSEDCETCPRGRYRPQKNSLPIGTRRRECEKCPRGRYGETAGLTESTCTAQCPAGRYSEVAGARTLDDCELCPPGRYGSTAGLASPACTAACPSGKSSSSWGLTASSQCATCPPGLRAWQCEDLLVARKGTINDESDGSPTIDYNEEFLEGQIVEDSHAYIVDNEDIPQGASPVAFDSWDPIHKTYDPALDNVREPTNAYFENANV